MGLYTKAATVEQGSKELYDLMDVFERTIGKVTYVSGDFSREDKSFWIRRIYYCNGNVNNQFLAFMQGYIHCKGAYNTGMFD
jgi:hypothetical protein